MAEVSPLISILSAIEEKLNSAIADSNNHSKFNENINGIEELLKDLNSTILDKKEDYIFEQNEKELMKNILANISKIEKINKNKLSFFDSLNKYFYDNVDKWFNFFKRFQ